LRPAELYTVFCLREVVSVCSFLVELDEKRVKGMWTLFLARLKSDEEGRAGLSCMVENRIFDGNIGTEVQLMRFKA